MPVANPPGCALFLDFDGTLVDIAPSPSLVHMRLSSCPYFIACLLLAILTGRPFSDINDFLKPLQPVTAGVHGSELRTEANGRVMLTVGDLDPNVAGAVHQLQKLDASIVIESKIYSVAVH
jgi:trehalose 6-phosphate phosphatase